MARRRGGRGRIVDNDIDDHPAAAFTAAAGAGGGRNRNIARRRTATAEEPAKEAAAKALGCGIGKVSWQDLEILNDTNGKPELILHTQAAEAASQAGWSAWSLSISHTRSYAIASVTALVELPIK
ncbi:MAG: hypothetical protein CVU45_00260 [Chloroflexi bacterium HGW-Chloroflexi-7]|nr:MAG: hypothetical protein CVU45_00260 [Chloroflexi bacterium HGW-Chloroflexi-7]